MKIGYFNIFIIYFSDKYYFEFLIRITTSTPSLRVFLGKSSEGSIFISSNSKSKKSNEKYGEYIDYEDIDE